MRGLCSKDKKITQDSSLTGSRGKKPLAKRKQKTKLNIELAPYAQYSLICHDAAQIVSTAWTQVGEATDRRGHEYQGDSPAATKWSLPGAIRKACHKAKRPECYDEIILWIQTWMRMRGFINERQSIVDWNEVICEDGDDAAALLKSFAKRMSKKWAAYAKTLSEGKKDEKPVWEP